MCESRRNPKEDNNHRHQVQILTIILRGNRFKNSYELGVVAHFHSEAALCMSNTFSSHGYGRLFGSCRPGWCGVRGNLCCWTWTRSTRQLLIEGAGCCCSSWRTVETEVWFCLNWFSTKTHLLIVCQRRVDNLTLQEETKKKRLITSCVYSKCGPWLLPRPQFSFLRKAVKKYAKHCTFIFLQKHNYNCRTFDGFIQSCKSKMVQSNAHLFSRTRAGVVTFVDLISITMWLLMWCS